MSDSTSQDPDDDAVEVIREGDGLVVLGSEAAVEGFLRSLGLWDPARDFRLPNLGTALRAASVVIEAASRAAANSGRYLMVTAETAAAMNKLDLIETGTKGVKYAVFGKPGRTEKWLQVMDGPKATLSNPANLTAVSGAMEQFARQAEMREIRAYLASIDRKVDEVITGHHNAEIGKLIGAGLDIESALLVLERQGFVDDDTWSTVQARHHTVTDAIGVAIKDLESVANKLEETAKPSALKDEVANAQARVRDLLAILARASELQVGLDQLRLQRVLDGDPDRIESMRETLREDRERRRAKITDAVDYLLARMDAAAGTAQANAILHRPAQTVIVTSINDLLDAVEGFNVPSGSRIVAIHSNQSRSVSRQGRRPSSKRPVAKLHALRCQCSVLSASPQWARSTSATSATSGSHEACHDLSPKRCHSTFGEKVRPVTRHHQGRRGGHG